MAFVKYENLHTPDEVIEKMHEYVGTTGNQISDALREDTNIYQRDGVDGKRFTFQDKNKEYFVNLRSANGTQIFGTNDDAEMDLKTKEKHKGYHGVGMVVSEGYSKTQRWYNQFNVPKKLKDKKVLGAWMPVSTGYEDLEEVPKPAKVDEPAEVTPPERKYSEIVIPPSGDTLHKPTAEDGAEQCRKVNSVITVGGGITSRATTDYSPLYFVNLFKQMVENTAYRTEQNYTILELMRGDPDYKVLKTLYNSVTHGGSVNPENKGRNDSWARAHGLFKDVPNMPNNFMGLFDAGVAGCRDHYTNKVTTFMHYLHKEIALSNWLFASGQWWSTVLPDYSNLYYVTAAIRGTADFYLPDNLYARNADKFTNVKDIEFDEYGFTTSAYNTEYLVITYRVLLTDTWQGRTWANIYIYYPMFALYNNNSINGIGRRISEEEYKKYSSNLEPYNLCKGYLMDGLPSRAVLSVANYGQGKHIWARTLENQMKWVGMSTLEYNKLKNATPLDFSSLKACMNDFEKNFDKLLEAYKAEKAKMDAEHDKKSKERDAEQKQFDDEYTEKRKVYDKYLEDKQKYIVYTEALKKYNKYLEDKARLENTYDLYCNHITAPTELITFSLVKRNKNDERFFQTTHLIFGMLNKYEAWNGGAFFSGSANQDMMQTAYQIYVDDDKISDRWTLPVLSSSALTNTYLRIDVDEAPLDIRGNVIWASSGHDNITGKSLALPIRNNDTDGAKIPSYYFMQSKERLDWGRNINTLNGITVDMPMFFAVKTDPEELNLYAAVGQATGIYFISMLNMQTAGTYERSYPKSGVLNQVFPMGRRRGNYGFDGIGIAQEETVDIAP